MDNKSIIVFGGTGFIGSHLCEFFTEHGYRVHSFGSKDCDLTDADAVQSLLNDHGENANIILCSSIGRLTDDSFESFEKKCGHGLPCCRGCSTMWSKISGLSQHG